jgi:hypothetical protein
VRRAAIVGGGVLALAAAVLLFVLALDVLRWRGHVEAADLRFAAGSGGAAMWEPETILPTGTSRSLLALEDDLEYRRIAQRFRVNRVRQLPRDQNDVARRARLEADLTRIGRTQADPRRRSLVATMQGALAFEQARADTAQAAVLLRRSLASFRRAAALDHANEDARYDVELVLRLLQQVENDPSAAGGGQRGDTQGSGAGAASGGTGY